MKPSSGSSDGPVSGTRRRRQPEEPAGFTEFYALYPRRVHPRDALKAYLQEVTTPELHTRLMDATRRALAGLFRHRPLDKTPYPATWIRSGTWQDNRSQLDTAPAEAAQGGNRPTADGAGRVAASSPDGGDLLDGFRDMTHLADLEPDPEILSRLRARLAEPLPETARSVPSGASRFRSAGHKPMGTA